MSPQQFRALRKRLGFTQPTMAAHLKLTNPPAAGRNAIARYERGHQKNGVPGPVEGLMEAYAGGFRVTCDLCGERAEDETVRDCGETLCPFQQKASS